MPLTACTPKPMLRVGRRPVLEVILRSLHSAGVTRVAVVVRYRHDRIVEHFERGRIPGLEVSFVREPFPMGTAGALGLLKGHVAGIDTVLVVNGDILTTLSFRSLLRFHRHARAAATVCMRPYQVRIPFGVPLCSEGRVVGFEEKPLKTFHVNAGIYCLPPSIVSDLSDRAQVDMPAVLKRFLDCRASIAVFPLVDPYHEIGTLESYRAAHAFYRFHRRVFATPAAR